MRGQILSPLLALLLWTSVACAQRPEVPRVPRAITDSQLQKYCDQLALSDEQRHAVELEFERYLDDFEPLRAEMSAAAIQNPKFTETDIELMRELPAFVARTQAADEVLFARMDALMIDAQRDCMRRIRMLRERTLLNNLSVINFIIGDGIPDVRALLESLMPPAEVIEPLATQLDDYETKLTTGMRSLFDDMMKLCASDAANAWAHRFPMRRDDPVPPPAPEVERVIADIRDLRNMNRRFVESTAPSLVEPFRSRWRDEFMLYAYGGGYDCTRLWVLAVIDAALDSELADDQRQAVAGLRQEILRVQDDARTKLMDALDRDAIGVAGPQGAVGNDELFSLLNSTRQDVMKRDREIHKSLQATLGADRVKALQETAKTDSAVRPYPSSGTYASYGLVAFTSRVTPRRSMRSVSAMRAEPLLAWPLEREEFDVWLAALAINGEARETIAARFVEYAHNLDSTLKPLQETAFRNSSHVMMGTPAKDPFERAKAAQEARVKMLAAVEAADAEFLAQLRDVAGENVDQSRWDQLARWRSRCLMGIDMSWRSGDAANISGGIDLIPLVLTQHLDSAQWAAIADLALAYADKLEPLMKQQRESISRLLYDQTAYRDGWRPDRQVDWDDESQHDRYRAMGELNRTTLQAMAALLPPELAGRIIDAFNRKAYPRAFDDPQCMDSALKQALALPSLTPAQHEDVVSIRLAFDEAYAQAVGQLVELCAGTLQFMPMAGRTITEDVAKSEETFNEEFARLSDAREEANRRALRGLRVTLLPPQMRQITLPTQE